MKVGKKRIAVVIGTEGEVKNEIERKLGLDIDIDSKTGLVEIKPNKDHPNYEPYNKLIANRIIKAISRGFNPSKAMKLLDENIQLQVVNLVSILGKSDKKLRRIKGRLIGRNGEMRKALEQYGECFVAIYGKTISVIAHYQNMNVVRKAINMLIEGTPHHVVLKLLERKYNERKKERFREMYKPEF
ncbi:MAG: KH domain-containing protein [Promethearchaeia archaeon]